MNKLAVFDLDSTLLAVESINNVLDNILDNTEDKNNLDAIRAQGMRGEIDLEASLKQRITFFKGLELERLRELCQIMPWTAGAKATITELKQRGYFTLCLSAGFCTATRRVISELDVDAYYCNALEHQNGILTGLISGGLMQHESKGGFLMEIQEKLEFSPANTLVIGDGANDLSMFQHADTRIAFCAQNILKDQATHIIERKDLREVLNILNF